MMLKQRAANKSSKINPNRAKIHSIKRFKAAAKGSRSLYKDNFDSMSTLEIEAY